MNTPIARPGLRVVAEIPPGSTIMATMYGNMPAWIVAHPDTPPYWLFADGTRKTIEPARA